MCYKNSIAAKVAFQPTSVKRLFRDQLRAATKTRALARSAPFRSKKDDDGRLRRDESPIANDLRDPDLLQKLTHN